MLVCTNNFNQLQENAEWSSAPVLAGSILRFAPPFAAIQEQTKRADFGKPVLVFWKREKSACGFTLLEMLVAIAILLLLGTLLMGTISRMLEFSHNGVCMANLRSIGVVLNLYASDNNGYLPPCYSYKENKTWLKYLMEGDYIPRVEVGKTSILICPSQSPTRWMGDSFTYGIRLPPDHVYTGASLQYKILGSTIHDVEGANYGSSLKFFLVSDSLYIGPSIPEKGNQCYYTQSLNDDLHVIHLRHHLRGNFLFTDGHIESLDKESLVNDTNNRTISSQIFEGPFKAL